MGSFDIRSGDPPPVPSGQGPGRGDVSYPGAGGQEGRGELSNGPAVGRIVPQPAEGERGTVRDPGLTSDGRPTTGSPEGSGAGQLVNGDRVGKDRRPSASSKDRRGKGDPQGTDVSMRPTSPSHGAGSTDDDTVEDEDDSSWLDLFDE